MLESPHMLIHSIKTMTQKLARRKRHTSALGHHFDMAMQLAAWGDVDTSLHLLQQCIEKNPNLAALHFYAGEMLCRKGNHDAAIMAYARALTLDPADAYGASIKLYLLAAHPQSTTLPLEYIRRLFDQYAQSFENCLLGNLDYKSPALVADAVKAQGQRWERMLDLGCGTGLSAVPLRTHTGFIEGVDVSAGMLQKAKEKKIYDVLHETEITAFLKSTKNYYDLVLCVDVLIYVGQCLDLFHDIAAVLTPNGLFAFTIQTSKTEEVVLGGDHRYSHNKPYIAQCLEQAGLEIRSCADAVLRQEQGLPVEGMIFVCRKK